MFRLIWKSLTQRLAEPPPPPDPDAVAQMAGRVDTVARLALGRSLAIKHVNAGSCNGCEIEIQALTNPYYALERFGFSFVVTPRHADVLLVTGPVTTNMAEALYRTWQATPEPKWVIASGACAIDGGVFAGSYAIVGGADRVIPVDMVIKGCPPSPRQLLAGLLALFEGGAATGTDPDSADDLNDGPQILTKLPDIPKDGPPRK